MSTIIKTGRACGPYEGAGVLGSMILDPNCIPTVLEWIDAESFYFAEHRAIFEAILSVWHRNPGGALDGLLLRSELERATVLESIGGLEYLRQVIESVPSSANAESVRILPHRSGVGSLLASRTPPRGNNGFEDHCSPSFCLPGLQYTPGPGLGRLVSGVDATCPEGRQLSPPLSIANASSGLRPCRPPDEERAASRCSQPW